MYSRGGWNLISLAPRNLVYSIRHLGLGVKTFLRSVSSLCGRGRETPKGPYLYDVRTEGGRGVPSKADIVIKLSKGGCVNLRTRGGEGVQKSENFADVICVSPLYELASLVHCYNGWNQGDAILSRNILVYN